MAPYRIGNDKAVRILGDPLLPDAMTGSARSAYHRNFVDKDPLSTTRGFLKREYRIQDRCDRA